MATQFRNQTWTERLDGMGDQAEGQFELMVTAWARTGLNRPDMPVGKLPLKLRYIPDYLRVDGWYEVQGCGRDQMFKFKQEKLEALLLHQQDHPVYLWLWDAVGMQAFTVSLDQLAAWCSQADVNGITFGMFPEGKRYVSIPVGLLQKGASVAQWN